MNREDVGRTLNYRDIGGLDAAMQDVRAATEAPALGVRRLRMLFSLIGWKGVNRVILPVASGRNRRVGARHAIQLLAADLRERQIGENKEKKKENYPVMQISSPY